MSIPISDAKLKLNYFNMRGRGELIRLLLRAAGKEFEDNRVSEADWPKLKESMPFKQMPVLEVTPRNGDPFKLTDSLAIARLIARQYGMYSTNPDDIYHIERFLSLSASFHNAIFALQTKKAENVKKLLQADDIHDLLLGIEEALKEKKGKFIVGDKLSIADLEVFNTLEMFKKCYPKEEHAAIQQMTELVNVVLQEKPVLKDYIRKRPNTDF